MSASSSAKAASAVDASTIAIAASMGDEASIRAPASAGPDASATSSDASIGGATCASVQPRDVAVATMVAAITLRRRPWPGFFSLFMTVSAETRRTYHENRDVFLERRFA